MKGITPDYFYLQTANRSFSTHLPSAGPPQEINPLQDYKRGFCGPYVGQHPSGWHKQWEGLLSAEGLRPEQAS